MRSGRWRLSPEVMHAIRVALVATAVIAVVYGGCAVVLERVVTGRLIAGVDARLQSRLDDRLSDHSRGTTLGDDDDQAAEPPVFFWHAGLSGLPVALVAGAPALPSASVPVSGRAATARLGPGDFRLASVRYRGGSLVAGQSLTDVEHLDALLHDGVADAAPVLLLAVFIGALTIGLRALSPVQRSRRRQLEFTADASHELRTPLSVISAETSVALSAPRAAADYQAALSRIQSESRRLSVIVDDMLWLARLDSGPAHPAHEPLDLGTLASQCAERFTALARSRSVEISVAATGSAPAWVSAPPDWIDRLAGVLLDNACRHAGSPGKVRITAASRGTKVTLAVEDSGPGIPPGERVQIFDRFHRSTERGGSAGLGLAIADSIVSGTGGQWRVGDSPLGGALFEVAWRRSSPR